MADKKIRSPEDATSFRYVSCAVKYEVISHSKGLLWITFTWISIIHFHAGTFFCGSLFIYCHTRKELHYWLKKAFTVETSVFGFTMFDIVNEPFKHD